MNLSELIVKLEEGQIAKGTFASESWYVINSFGFIRYLYNNTIGETVPLTFSNINAKYEIQ